MSFLGHATAVATAAGILAVGTVAVTAVVAQAPAFNEALQVEGITGSPRVADLPAMYYHSEYLYQTGYGYLAFDLLSFAGLEDETEVASFEVAEERLRLAQTYLEEAIRRDPANAYAWLAYAQTLASIGDPEDAVAALDRSHVLAPTTLPLATTRLYTIGTLREVSEDPDILSAVYDMDLEVVRFRDPGLVEALTTDLDLNLDADLDLSPERILELLNEGDLADMPDLDGLLDMGADTDSETGSETGSGTP